MKEQSRGNSTLCFSKIQKDFGKSLKNPLTKSESYAIIRMFQEGKSMAGKTSPAPPADERDVKLKNKKSFTKPLDKTLKSWYNSHVIKENDTPQTRKANHYEEIFPVRHLLRSEGHRL